MMDPGDQDGPIGVIAMEQDAHGEPGSLRARSMVSVAPRGRRFSRGPSPAVVGPFHVSRDWCKSELSPRNGIGKTNPKRFLVEFDHERRAHVSVRGHHQPLRRLD